MMPTITPKMPAIIPIIPPKMPTTSPSNPAPRPIQSGKVNNRRHPIRTVEVAERVAIVKRGYDHLQSIIVQNLPKPLNPTDFEDLNPEQRAGLLKNEQVGVQY